MFVLNEKKKEEKLIQSKVNPSTIFMEEFGKKMEGFDKQVETLFHEFSETGKRPHNSEINQEKNGVEAWGEDPKLIFQKLFEPVEKKLRKDDLYQLLPKGFIKEVTSKLEAKLKKHLHDSLSTEDTQEDLKVNLATKSMGTMSRNFISKYAKEILNTWYSNHKEDPYPSLEEKKSLAKQANISLKQLNNWFVNMRGKVPKEERDKQKFSTQIRKKICKERVEAAREDNPMKKSFEEDSEIVL